MRSGKHDRGTDLSPMDARAGYVAGCAALGAVAVSGSAIVVLSIATFATIAPLAAGAFCGELLLVRMALPGGPRGSSRGGAVELAGGQVLAVLPVGPWAITVTEAGLRAGTLAGARVGDGSRSAGIDRWRFGRVPIGRCAMAACAGDAGGAGLADVPLPLPAERRGASIVRALSRCVGLREGMQSVRCAAAAGALFLRAYERGVRIHHAMLLRGYQGELPEERLPRRWSGINWPIWRLGWYCWPALCAGGSGAY